MTTVPLLERAFIARNISVMLKSGLTLSESLSLSRSQIKHQPTKELLKHLEQDVTSGIPFTEALKKKGSSFGSLFTNFVSVGEASGNLEETLGYLSTHYEIEHDIRQKVRSALIYPLIIFGIIIVYAAIFSFLIFPRLQTLFGTITSLPPITRFVISVSAFMRSWGWLCIIACIALGILLKIFSKRAAVATFLDPLLLHLPVIGSFIKKQELARLFRTLHFFVKSGIPIVEAIASAKSATDNVVVRSVLQRSEAQLREGKMLADTLDTHFFPVVPIRLVAVGEKSGSLEETMQYLANFYEKDLDNGTKNLMSVLEPVLLIIVGIAVALLAIAIILPIYQFTGSLRVF